EGVVSCNGCGRCITGCPVSVDIREMVVRATEANEETPNA
ncbi:MAG TPA: hydrogenase, partial [Nitratidesulfovibrio sp.]|nr:hydrogenase [Nitratidesulfovibrio sp.]